MRYGLLLWLSVLVLVPFDLSTADSFSSLQQRHGSAGREQQQQHKTQRDAITSAAIPNSCVSRTPMPAPAAGGYGSQGIVALLISVCSSYLSDPGPVREASAVCLAKLLTRPDMEGERLHAFMNAAVDTLAACVLKPSSSTSSSFSAVQGFGDSDLLGIGLFSPAAVGLPVNTSSFDAASSLASAAGSRAFLVTGILQTLSHIAKFGHRRALTSVLGDVFDRVVAITTASSRPGGGASSSSHSSGGIGRSSGGSVQLRSSPLLRKLLVKLASRTGLTYLPPRLQPWRYARGSRSLLLNLAASGVASAASAAPAATVAPAGSGSAATFRSGDNDDDYVDVPPQMEDIIDMLLTGLRDSDTVVRWAAAKGIGRVTGRLPLELADDVVAAVLDLLQPTEGDAAWHGGCLALAELGRRGLLLPERLPAAIPCVLSALCYDVRRGSHSVGAHVRDAACYVCWAFARAYEPGVMAPHVADLAQGMLITALFDREVNCRRAAAAAFQENVGRQGAQAFPYGIDILTAADYFTLGNRGHAYTAVAPIVASFPPYRHALREHVLRVKIRHWDPAVRALAAKSLAALAVSAPLDASWVNDVALPALLPGTTSPELFTRHGSILALAELVLAAASTPALVIPQATLDEVRNVVVKAEKARAYTGRGGESVRSAMCRLIACQCLAGHAISRKAALRLLQTLDDCLKHPNGTIQADAATALRALTSHALAEPEPAFLDRLTRGYVSRLKTEENPAVRRGMVLALGALPRSLLLGAQSSAAATAEGGSGSSSVTSSSSGSDGNGLLDDVISALITATKQERLIQKRDAETRRNAAQALASIVRTVGIGHRALLTAAVASDSSLSSVEVLTSPPHSAPSASSPGPFAATLSSELQPGLSPPQFNRILSALLHCTWDYATDNRGDVGSWVRQAVLEGIEAVLLELLGATHAHSQASAAVSALTATSPPAKAAALVSAIAALPFPSAALPAALLQAFPPKHAASASASSSRIASGLPQELMSPGAAAGEVLKSAVERPSALVTCSGMPLGSLVSVAAAGDRSPSGSEQAGIVGRLQGISACGTVAHVACTDRSSSSFVVLPASDLRPLAASSGLSGPLPRVQAVVMLGHQPLSTETGSASPSSSILQSLASVLSSSDILTSYLPQALLTDVIAAYLRIGAEKLDRLRGVACETLCRLLHVPLPLLLLPYGHHRDQLIAAFPLPLGLLQQLRSSFASSASSGIAILAAGASEPASAPVSSFGGFDDDFGGEDAEDQPEETPIVSAAAETSGTSGAGAGEAVAGQPASDATSSERDAGIVPVATTPSASSTTSSGQLLQWHLPRVSFPRTASLLPQQPYTRAIITGLVTSVGGLSETVVRYSSSALISWAAEAVAAGREDEVERVASSLLSLLKPRRKMVRATASKTHAFWHQSML